MTPPPTNVGPYAIEREIGRGGMGEVYLARDTELHREVAIKCLPDHLADDPDRLARFEREARIFASLQHPGIAGVYALEEHAGKKYLAMEHGPGETPECPRGAHDHAGRGGVPLSRPTAVR